MCDITSVTEPSFWIFFNKVVKNRKKSHKYFSWFVCFCPMQEMYQAVTQVVTKTVTESSAVACVIDEIVDDVEHEDQKSQKSQHCIWIKHWPGLIKQLSVINIQLWFTKEIFKGEIKVNQPFFCFKVWHSSLFSFCYRYKQISSLNK